jgi:hypothetical protein
MSSSSGVVVGGTQQASRRSPAAGVRTTIMPSGLLLAMCIILLSGCAIADRIGGVSEARELKRTGFPASGTILKIWDTGITINNDPVIGMLLKVAADGRAPYVATIKRMRISRLDVPRFQPRAVVPLRVDPNDPERIAVDLDE